MGIIYLKKHIDLYQGDAFMNNMKIKNKIFKKIMLVLLFMVLVLGCSATFEPKINAESYQYDYYGNPYITKNVYIDGAEWDCAFYVLKDESMLLDTSTRYQYGRCFILESDFYPSDTIDIFCTEDTTINLNGYNILGDNVRRGHSLISINSQCNFTLQDLSGKKGQIININGIGVLMNHGNITLTLENVSVNHCTTGIKQWDAGCKLILNNASICKNDVGITADRGYLYSNGTTAVFDNNMGISASCNEVYLFDQTTIYNNDIGVNISSLECNLSIEGGIQIRNNITAGLMVCNGQQLYFSSLGSNGYDSSLLVECKVSDADSDQTEIAIIASPGHSDYKSYIRSQGGTPTVYNTDSSLIGEKIRIRSVDCETHDYKYNIGDFSIDAKCNDCYLDGSLAFSMDAFDDEDNHAYYEGSNISERIVMTSKSWNTNHNPKYYALVYGQYDYDTGEKIYSTTVPNKAGVYTVKLAILGTENDVNTECASTEEHVFAITPKEGACSHDEACYYQEYYDGLRVITARCNYCGKLVMKVAINTNNTDFYSRSQNDGRAILYECSDKIIAKWEGNEDYLEYLTIVYGTVKNDGSIKYSFTEPTEPGKYTAYIAILEDDNNPKSILLSTEEISYELQYHLWRYSSDDTSLYAHCSICNENAAVHLEKSGVEYANRHYDTKSTKEHFDYDVFYQENWVGQKGIEQFYILYDGLAVEDEFNSTLKKSVYYKPTVSGNYSARIVLLKDVYNPQSAYLTTGEMNYFLAGVSIGNPYLKIVDYSEEQYAALQAPEYKDAAYQVDSFEDLMWVSRYCAGSEKINITSDIIANPITITDDGKTIRCGSNVIYQWLGIGNSKSGKFWGNIYGNGHTIYGLYSKGKEYAGLIGDGYQNGVYDLTISDSVLCGTSAAGGIIAHETVLTGGDFIAEPIISRCNVLNCVISQSTEEYGGIRAAAGLIGVYYPCDKANLTLRDCIVDSSINGDTAGGMLGRYDYRSYDGNNVKLYINHCINLGDIEGDRAGGIIGSFDQPLYFDMQNCVNAGTITGSWDAGGIFGRLSYPSQNSVFANNTNIGKLSARTSGGKIGGLFGTIANTSIISENNRFYGAENAAGEIYSGNVECNIGNPVKLSKEEATLENICYQSKHIECSNWICTSLADCEHSGQLVKKCMVCGKVLVSRDIPAHGHNYGLENKCVYCLESGSSGNTASVFSDVSVGLYITTGVIAIAVVAIIIIRKKKRNN